IQEHIDPSLMRSSLDYDQYDDAFETVEKRKTPYDDLCSLDQQEPEKPKPKRKKFLHHPEKDVLLFIQEYSRELEDWQRDIMTMIREEMLYFWPQLETKIMNEGWATYWHQRIMREMDLTTEEAIEY